jgi:hypothetical protein
LRKFAQEIKKIRSGAHDLADIPGAKRLEGKPLHLGTLKVISIAKAFTPRAQSPQRNSHAEASLRDLGGLGVEWINIAAASLASIQNRGVKPLLQQRIWSGKTISL